MEVAISIPLYPTFLDYPDPESYAVCVSFVGCSHNCKGCHNVPLQKRETAPVYKLYDMEGLLSDLRESTKRNRTDKVVLSGGDPLHPENIEFVKEFLQQNTEYKIVLYTGYDIDFVKEQGIKCDFIKCGKYDASQSQQSEKTGSRMVLASKNQILYDSEYKALSVEGIYSF